MNKTVRSADDKAGAVFLPIGKRLRSPANTAILKGLTHFADPSASVLHVRGIVFRSETDASRAQKQGNPAGPANGVREIPKGDT